MSMNDIMYSLRVALDNFAPTTWVFDGVDISGKAKPFLTIENLTGTIDRYSKDRFGKDYLVQIGVYGDTVFNRNELQDEIVNRLESGDIDLYETGSGTPVLAGSFYAEVSSVEPMPQDEANQTTMKHRSYITITIRGN